jgi:two-component system NtrC family sensor kinase
MNDKDLERLTQLAMLANLSTGVLHTLNNILQAISGYGQLALHRFPEEMSSETLGRIVEWAQEAGRQSRAVLALGRRNDSPQRGEVEVAVKRTAEMFITHSLDNESIDIGWSDLGWLPPVSISTESLQIVLANLVRNALEVFQGRGGAVRLRAEEGDKAVVLKVWNSGPQIPEHTLRRLFTPWLSTKPMGEGHGIGLYLSRELLQRAGGTIEARNLESGGVEFSLTLPATEDEVPMVKDPGKPEELQMHGRRVLLVEDDESVREVMEMVIPEFTGADIEVADSGSRAVELLADSEYDVILLDLRMPGMNGQQVFGALSTYQQDRVVFVTGDIVSPGIREFLDRSGRPVLLKPIDMVRLIEAMQRSLPS